MRILAGKYARRKLESPSWSGVRPLLSRLRQPLFDTLMPFLPRGPFLDCFGGTGAFALEALSRGAPEATAIELDPRTVRLIEKNAQSIGVEEPLTVHQGDALEWLSKLARFEQQFAVIAMAPPYHQGLEQQMLEAMDAFPQLLQPDGVMFVQYPSQLSLPLERAQFELWKTRKYGNTSFSYYFSLEE